MLIIAQVQSYLVIGGNIRVSLAGLFAMIDQRRIQCGVSQSTWVHCPTCRIRTDYGNIAYVDDGQQISSLQNSETSPEDSINVQGSYSTKVNYLPVHCQFNNRNDVNLYLYLNLCYLRRRLKSCMGLFCACLSL